MCPAGASTIDKHAGDLRHLVGRAADCRGGTCHSKRVLEKYWVAEDPTIQEEIDLDGLSFAALHLL